LIANVKEASQIALPKLAQDLGLDSDIARLRREIVSWVGDSNPEVREYLRWQLCKSSKYYRPVTVFACYHAVSLQPTPIKVMRSAMAVEMVHNVSLIIDDILDRSRYRRGEQTLHWRFGLLPALMTAGYLYAGACKLLSGDSYALSLICDLLQRLGIAECLQWRLRCLPLGVGGWRMIASEDTGSMFETCARLGTRDGKLGFFGKQLGILYHGCDDVADVRGSIALGGGGRDDIRDGILTLPAAIASLDPVIALSFRSGPRNHLKQFMPALRAAIPLAEDHLDSVAQEARSEAVTYSSFPDVLLELIQFTRKLSKK
jgi:geranylgeranyl diphosphate synthase, type I